MRKKKLAQSLILLILVVIGVRAAMPIALQQYVNRKLDASPSYDGEVGDIDLSLIRGAYNIENVSIVKTDSEVPVPLFSAENLEFSVLWSALLRGAVVAEMGVDRAIINIVDGDSEAKQQTGEEGGWLRILNDLFPLRIDQVQIRDSELHFRNYDFEPPVDIYLSNFDANAWNLSNSEDLTDTMVASLEASANVMESSEISVSMKLNPTLQQPTFDLNARMLDLPIMSLDNFISAYAPFDVEGGRLDVVTELAAHDGRLEGYVKPIIHELDVFKWKEDIVKDKDNPIVAIWESLVGFMAEILQNQRTDQLASNVPISGDISDVSAGVLATIGNILKNAFVEAFRPDFDNTIDFNFDATDEDKDSPVPEPQSLDTNV